MSLSDNAKEMISEFGYSGTFIRHYSNATVDIATGTVTSGNPANIPLVVYSYMDKTSKQNSSDVRGLKVMALVDSSFNGTVPTGAKWVRDNQEFDIVDSVAHEVNGQIQYVDLFVNG